MKILHAWILFVLMVAASFAAPTPNITTTIYETPTPIPTREFGRRTIFAPEPNGRGTVGILTSCSATFFFCVWTAVHPNIIPGADKSQRYFYKAILMLVAILVPEGVMICAWREWREASHLLHKLKGTDLKKTGLKEFRMTEAFFVVMGGFIIKSERGKVTLTPDHFFECYEKGLIDGKSFNLKDIQDKNKSNSMAKFLSSSQALWLIVQCIARLKSGLQLTLLEVHVSIQVICSLVVVACWWEKPSNVNEPITIALLAPQVNQSDGIEPSETLNDELHKIARLPCSLHFPFAEKNPEESHKPERDRVAIVVKAFYDIVRYIGAEGKRPGRVTPPEATLAPSETTPDAGKQHKIAVIYLEAILICCTGALHAAAWNLPFPTLIECWLWRGSSLGMCAFPLTAVFIASFTPYEEDLIALLWKTHLCGLSRHDFMEKAFREIGHTFERHACPRKARDSKLDCNPNAWAGKDCEPGELGCKHVTSDWGCKHKEQSRWYYVRYTKHVFLVCCGVFTIFAYVACILFITLESYLSIRLPPPGSFSTPSWSDYWPHV